MKCLNLSQLIAYQYRSLSESDLQKIEQHLQSCSNCQEMLKTYEKFRFAVKDMLHEAFSSTENCPDEHEWVSYLRGRLRKKSRKRLYLHLGQCQSCLNNLVAYKRLLGELENEGLLPVEKGRGERMSEILEAIRDVAGTTIRSLWDSLAAPKAAYLWIGAAVVLIALGVALFRSTNMVIFPIITRENSSDQFSPYIQIQVPTDKGFVQDPHPEFRWVGPSGIDYYIFLLLDADGEIIWEEKTINNTLTLPQEVKLLPAMTYFWQVEGYYDIGGSVLSDMNRFTVKPE